MITLGNLTGIGRTLVRDGCTGKKVYESYTQASKSISDLERNNAHRPHLGVLEPYRCDICQEIHIGHSQWRGMRP